MLDRPVRDVIQARKLITATEATTVAEAARIMRDAAVGAILITKRDHLIGIFTERDALTRVIAAGLDPAHTRLADVMTREPRVIESSKPFRHALIEMHERNFRHMPVVEKGRPIGVVSMRDARPPELDHLAHDVEDREHIAQILG